MAFLDWDEEYSVGVEEIDEQHKRLFQLLNEFYDGITEYHTQALEELLNSLVDYTRYHFSTEEEYMEKFDYPDTGAHKDEHAIFTRKISDVKERLSEGTLRISFEITDFLKAWISDHLLVTDKKFSKCFNENGLK